MDNPNLLLVQAFQNYYVGYGTNPIGAIIGFFWGFINCFFVGAIWAFVFNWLGKIPWIRKWG